MGASLVNVRHDIGGRAHGLGIHLFHLLRDDLLLGVAAFFDDILVDEVGDLDVEQLAEIRRPVRAALNVLDTFIGDGDEEGG